MTLKQTQHVFLEYLMAPQNKSSQSLIELVADNGTVAPDIGMQIYANAYQCRLKETIETDHEHLCTYLGDELFEQMAMGFISAYPSHFRSLRDYCDALPTFLREDTYFSQFPILADMASFERRLLNSFDAADALRANYSELQALPAEFWPECNLRLHPSVQIFSCESNAVQCWQALKKEEAPCEADYSVNQHWLLWRSEERRTEFLSLKDYQLSLIKGVMKGNNFSELCTLMLDWTEPGQAPVEVLKSVKSWFDMQLIQKLVCE